MTQPVIKIIHKMRNKNLPNTFYVGRPTVLGNPFTHYQASTLADIKVDTLDEAVMRYEEYFYTEVENGNQQIIDAILPILEALEQGKTVHLSCWCKDEVTPFSSDNELCHADVIRNALLDELEAED